ncbi:hypothetical protein O6H91_21G029700 [Diphasiastrum complanatum]|uniref:Uncharacterized protein n=1 Tax=Diphasiastrum complanatum TaxID=34168 RepID=A0ACC2AKV0_DIPCM|nr:hypothetical protein O6H91_21G029700 [Diphasiastrum complanatum]
MGVEEWDSISRWTGLVASIWIQSFAGTTATFAAYSPCLKSELHYSQVQLNNLGVAKDFGENVGLVAGYFSNKFPAWALLGVASSESFVGYGVLWLVASERIGPPPYWQMCIVQCLAANSCTWFNTAILVTTMRNFPRSRGTVVGIVKGFIGLSASVSKEDPDAKGNFLFIHVICIGLAIYLLGTTLTENLLSLKTPLVSGIFTAVMFLFLIAPLYVPTKLFLRTILTHGSSPDLDSLPSSTDGVQAPLLEHVAGSSSHALPNLDGVENGTTNVSHGGNGIKSVDNVKANRQPIHTPPTIGTGEWKTLPSFEAELILDYDPGVLLAVGEGAIIRKRRPRRGEDFNLRQTLVKADFWLLFFVFFCGIGTGVTAANNLGQMGQAQGYRDAAIFVALFALGNFIGRLGGGSASEYYLRFGMPRTLWIAGAQAVLVFVHLLFATAAPGSLYIGSTVLGICYGIHYSVVVPTLSELFGLKHFGKIYNVLTIGDPIASVLLSGLLAGYLYDQEAKKQFGLNSTLWDWRSGTLQSGNQHCTGAHCFRLTFIIMAGICVIGVVLNIVLSIRIRPVYKALYENRNLPLLRDSDTETDREPH